MSIAKLLSELDNCTSLPIKVNEIADLVRKYSAQDQILFFACPELNSNICRGFLKQFHAHSAPYAEPTLLSYIVYSENQDIDWQRLTCVKELVHILDNGVHSAKTREEISNLLDIMSSPLDVGSLGDQTVKSLNDHTAIIPALGLLVPKRARSILREKYEAGIYTAREVAQIAAIPERYAESVLRPEFEKYLELCAAIAST